VSREDAALERLRAALDELAAEETAALLAEARAEARVRVRTLLAEALAERMVARAEAELSGGSPASPRRTEQRRRSRGRGADAPAGVPGAEQQTAPGAPDTPAGPRGGARGWYVYAIVDEDFEAPPMRGVDDEHGLEVVRAAGLGALTSRVALSVFGERELQERIEDLAWLERHARRHEQILESVREQRATVVPMRLFTIYESADSLQAMLEREQVFLRQALGRLAGRTEWGVKLFAGPRAATATPDAEPEAGGAGPGESYMRRRRAADLRSEEASQELHERAEQAHRRIAACAVEARVNPLQPPELSEHEGAMLLNGVYLVDNDAIEAFSAQVTSLQEEYAGEGIDVLLTGPWPPYNFVNSGQEAGV
jgi:gas vesicle protein GvpL/GvpF